MITKKAVAYLRTSSATNVGLDKDSDKRQMAAIEKYATREGYDIVLPAFYDAAVSGSDPVVTRAGFSAMLAFLGAHSDVRTILVETANRFARDLMVQETGYAMLQSRGIILVAVDSPDSFVSDTPTAKMVRQILGSVAEFEKAMLVSKLKSGRDRKRALTGKCGGMKTHAERHPDVVALAKSLRDDDLTMRQISAKLADAGHYAKSGKPFGPSAIKSMLEG